MFGLPASTIIKAKATTEPSSRAGYYKFKGKGRFGTCPYSIKEFEDVFLTAFSPSQTAVLMYSENWASKTGIHVTQMSRSYDKLNSDRCCAASKISSIPVPGAYPPIALLTSRVFFHTRRNSMNEQKSVKLSFTAADLKQQPGMAVVTDVKAGIKRWQWFTTKDGGISKTPGL